MRPKAWLRRSPLFGYVALTFAWSWACWALSPAVKARLPWFATLLMFAGSFGPGLAAVVVVANTGGRAGLRAWLSRCLEWRIGWGWLAFALLFPLVVMSVAAGLHIALGGAIATSPASGHLLKTVVNFFLVFLLGGPMGEEFGWLVNHTAGSVVAALVLHTAINFWPTVVPVLPTELSYRAYALVVAILVLMAMGLFALPGAVGATPRFVEEKP